VRQDSKHATQRLGSKLSLLPKPSLK